MRASIETPGEYRIAGEKEGKVERLSKKVAGPGRWTRRRTRSDLYLIKITRRWEHARHASQDIRGRLGGDAYASRLERERILVAESPGKVN